MTHFPPLFVSHGAPTYALEPGTAGAQLQALGRSMGRPSAVVVVSPHWSTSGVLVTASLRPETIHDFGGFDPALYRMRYPAPGHPLVARRAVDMLLADGWNVSLDPSRGLDHGAWVPLMHLYPQADVPVVQVSMPRSLDAASALRLGRSLSPLGDEGVLLIGSGSLTHNLYEFRQGTQAPAPYAATFSEWIRHAVLAGDQARLASAQTEAPHFSRAHPTIEHFLPLLVALGAAKRPLPATALEGGIAHGVLSMESYVFGASVDLETQGALA